MRRRKKETCVRDERPEVIFTMDEIVCCVALAANLPTERYAKTDADRLPNDVKASLYKARAAVAINAAIVIQT